MTPFRVVPIGELIQATRSWNPTRQAPSESFVYIDLSAVDQDVKQISESRSYIGKEAPSRARQLVEAGDVLVSTVRPNLNGVARVPRELHGATASTGFCVLRSHPARLDSNYLFHWVRSRTFVAEMTRKATGANYPAITDRTIGASTIPLPSLHDQHRIAGILDRADALRAKRRSTIASLDQLAKAVFVEIFGDPVSNSKNFPTGTLTDLGSLDRGVSKHRPRNAPNLLGGPYPFVQTGDIANSDGYVRKFVATYSEAGLRQSKMWPAGTLCITIAANIARTGILTFEACFPDSVVGFRSDPATVEYVRHWLSFLQSTLEARAPESAQKNINLAILRELEVPVPPADLRRMFLKRLTGINAVSIRYQNSRTQCDALFESLQQAAFQGAL